jgi:biotin transporter BioY
VLAVLGFAVATALGDALRLPYPDVPLATRLLPAIVAGALLGPFAGAISQALFALSVLAAGLVAPPLPVDLGYPLGLPACAALVGWAAGPDRKPRARRILLAGLGGLLVVHAAGFAVLAWRLPPALPQPIGWGGLLRVGFLFPLPWDLAQVVLAAVLVPRIRRRAPWLAFPDLPM